MSQLSEVASVSRKIIKYGGISLVLMMVVRGMFGVAYKWWKVTHPDPPPPPDTRFGKLPMLKFPVTDMKGKFVYKLETPTGSLPRLDTQFPVYFMPIKKPSLFAYDDAVKLAQSMGFIQDPQKLSESDYRWVALFDVPASFDINIITGEFVFDKQWQASSLYTTPTLFIDKDKAVNLVKNYLSKLGLLPDDMVSGESKVYFLKIQNGKLVSAPSLSKSQFLRVDLFRNPINGVKVVTPYADKGLISSVIALQREEGKQFVRIEYKYFPVNLKQMATYPLIGVERAWQKLQNGEAFIASANMRSSTVTVRDIYLAYYDSHVPQQFMQPVYVFEGDDGFVAYVPAVADSNVSSR